VYTPKDFDITQIMRDIVELLGRDGAAANGAAPVAPSAASASSAA
jgi:hypothetical protein